VADQIKNESPGFHITLGSDNAKYKIGDKCKFLLNADRDCHVLVLNIGTSGKTVILFPNKWNPNNKVEKGKNYLIPPDNADFYFKVLGPTGTERIKAVASLDPILQDVASLQEELSTPPGQAQGSTPPFVVVKNPEVILKDVGAALSKVDPGRWSTVELTFKVDPAGSESQGSAPESQSGGTGQAPAAAEQAPPK